MLAHLLFGGETFTELVEYQIGADRRNAAYKDHKHPFHDFAPTFLPINGNGVSASLSSSDPADSGGLSTPPSDHGSSPNDDGRDRVPNHDHDHDRARPSLRSGPIR